MNLINKYLKKNIIKWQMKKGNALVAFRESNLPKMRKMNQAENTQELTDEKNNNK